MFRPESEEMKSENWLDMPSSQPIAGIFVTLELQSVGNLTGD
jgi:hypothetical protein